MLVIGAKEMKTAIGYARLSRDENKSNHKSLSIDYQTSEITKLAKSIGYNLIDMLTDVGLSGKSIKSRPGIKRIIQMVSDKSIDAVLTYRSDRISRDGIQSLTIESLFRDCGVEYISCTEGKMASGTIDDTFLSYIRAGLNQRERHLISMRTRQALQLKKSKGERLGSMPRYGWEVINGQLLQHPGEQSVIRRTFELLHLEYSTRAIANIINLEGYRSRRNKEFRQTQIMNIIHQHNS